MALLCKSYMLEDNEYDVFCLKGHPLSADNYPCDNCPDHEPDETEEEHSRWDSIVGVALNILNNN